MSKKSKTTTGPSKQALPHINAATNAVNNTYAANQGNLAGISGKLGDMFNSYSAGIGKDPLMGAAKGYATDVLGGKYLTGNPHLEAMIGQTGDDVTDRVNAIFGRAGQVGSSRYGGEMTKQLSNAENGLRYQNYSDEMNRMGAAAGLVPSLNSAENADYATALGLGSAAAEIPYLGADFLAKNMGGLWGGAQTSTQKQGLGQTLLNLGQTAAMVYASDPRLKTDIAKHGELPDGLGIYSWRYIWDETKRHIGVMADEIARLRPWALGPRIAGEYLTVNYGAL